MPSFIILPILHFEKSLTRTRKDSCARSCQLFEYQQPKSPHSAVLCSIRGREFLPQDHCLCASCLRPAARASHDAARSRGCHEDGLFVNVYIFASVYPVTATISLDSFFCRPGFAVHHFEDALVFDLLIPSFANNQSRIWYWPVPLFVRSFWNSG